METEDPKIVFIWAMVFYGMIILVEKNYTSFAKIEHRQVCIHSHNRTYKCSNFEKYSNFVSSPNFKEFLFTLAGSNTLRQYTFAGITIISDIMLKTIDYSCKRKRNRGIHKYYFARKRIALM